MRTFRILAVVMLLALGACATASVSYSDVAPGSTPVSAESSTFNLLGLTPTSIDRLAGLRDDLAAQCGDRGVTGVVAQTSTVYLVVGFMEKTEVMGYCANP